MAILVHCPNCERLAQIPHDSAGQTVRCTGCKQTFVVPPGTAELDIEWGPIGAGRRIPLSPNQIVTIGRTKDNIVSLPGAFVSRRHATLKWNVDEWRVHDGGSTNGTFVNGERIRDLGLTDGSRIVIGDFAMRLGVTSSGPTELDRALDAIALDETRAGMLAVVGPEDAHAVGADSRADTAFGQVLPSMDDQAAPRVRRRRPRLLERWPVVVALAVVVIAIVVLLVSRLAR